jgi:acetyl-CoA carboxylase biotin carboxyl carrier protein
VGRRFLIPDRAVSLLRRLRRRARISQIVHFISMIEMPKPLDEAAGGHGDKDLSATQISFQDVLQLVELVKSSANFSELRIRSGDLEIDVRRGPGGAPAVPAADTAARSPIDTLAPADAVRGQAAGLRAPAASAKPVPAPTPPARAALPAGASVVRAPMVGTIYLAPEPGAAPFVKVGQQVAAGDQLCIIEVMKLMNAVTAEQPGTVSDILAGDGEAVEFGQDLFVIAPG